MLRNFFFINWFKSYKTIFSIPYNILPNLSRYNLFDFKDVSVSGLAGSSKTIPYWFLFKLSSNYSSLNSATTVIINKHLNAYTYLLPNFFKKLFNFNKKLNSLWCIALTNLLWHFNWYDIEFFFRYVFMYVPIKDHKRLYLLVKQVVKQTSFSKKLIFLSIQLKGKFSVYGDARKKMLKYSLGPFYTKVYPRFGLNTYLVVKKHYFIIYTTTGTTSFIGYIKHTH